MSLQELERAKEIIYNHDLSPTIRRMVTINKWSEKHAKEACKQYRNYLFLKLKYGSQYNPHDLPPSVDIDEIWHNHILHTEGYTEFCKKVFGTFLHHHPHHGKNNEMTDQELNRAFEETQRLYLKEFDEYIYSVRPTGIQMKIFTLFENFVKFLESFRLKSVTIRP